MSYNSFASVYDELTKNVDYERFADYVCEILKNNGITDGLLLDLACGTGSLSVLLAAKGFEVIASDASADMLSVAREKAYDRGVDIMFLCQRMEESDLYGTVRAAVCSLDSINHLDSLETVGTVFKRLSNFIDDGGIVIFDVNTLYKHQKVLADNTFVYDEKNVYCVWRNSLHPDGRTVGINLDFFVREGECYNRYGESFTEIAFTDSELTAAAEKGDFTVVDRFHEFTFDAPRGDSERVFYVLRRNER